MKFNPTFLSIADLLQKCFSSQNYCILSPNQDKAIVVVLLLSILLEEKNENEGEEGKNYICLCF